MSKSVLFAVAASLLVVQAALADETLTMAQAVSLSLANNPSFRAARRTVEAAASREIQAAAWPNPNVSLMVDQVPFKNPGGGNYMAGISQPLLVGNQREARVEVARLDRIIADLERETTRRDLIAKVKDAFVQLLFEEQGAQLAGLSEEAAASVLKATRARFKVGELAQVEVLRAEVEHGRARREHSSALNHVTQARGHLNVLMGRQAQVPFAAVDVGLPVSEALPPLAGLVGRGLGSRVELRLADLAIQREELQRRLVRSGLWTGTEVSVAGGAIAGQPGFSTSLTLPVPLYQQQGELAETEANRLRAEAERESLRNEIGLEITQAYQDALNAAQQAALFRQSYVPQAERLAENAQRRFLEGEGTGLEVLEARRALREARTEFQRALLEHREALAHLERAVGTDLLTP